MIDAESFLRTHPAQEVGEPNTSEVESSSFDTTCDAVLVSDEEKVTLYERCMSSALRSLDAASASVEGLRLRLIAKGFDAEIVAKVLATLQRMKLIDDEAFAEGLMRRYLSKMMGASAIRRQMISKGVDASITEHLIERARADGSLLKSARELVESVEHKTQGMEYTKRLRRLASAAQRKGHCMADIREYSQDFFIRSE